MRRFFRRLLIYRRIDWNGLQALIIHKTGEDRIVPFLKSFILALMEELSLSLEMIIFQDSNKVGYHIGSTLRKIETNQKRLKKTIFDFRRCRRPQDQNQKGKKSIRFPRARKFLVGPKYKVYVATTSL